MFAAGNDGSEANSAAEEILNIIYTIAISSVGLDRVTNYGQIGSNIMAVTQGGDMNDRVLVSFSL